MRSPTRRPVDNLERERRALTLFDRAADVPEADRETWLARETGGDGDLAARLRSLLAADARAALRTGGGFDDAEEPPPPTRIGAYRLTGLIGRGGMGAVYRGERDAGDFEHTVAIKLIRATLAGDALRERFRRERQTLAGLSHPNIAQLFDGGEVDGAPYIIMELVDGEPIDVWATAHGASLDERVRMFETVCRAVAFAHRSLIVHRDLTPSNVLVTKDGVPKLIDFGIAKPSDDDGEDGERPSLASLSLTPGFAAPERTTSARVTTAADIFSLGRVLDVLAPDGDRDLKAIVACATATDPGDRYPTADALAMDVAAWWGGLPVAARNGASPYRLRRFIARNRVASILAAAAAVALIAALIVTLTAYARADAARRDAEYRFQQTRSIAKSMMGEVYDAMNKVPGSTTARELLARTSLTYMDALASDSKAPRDVRIEAARGYTRLSIVTGGGQGGQLGRFKDADALLVAAEKIIKPLYDTYPELAEVRKAYAGLLLEQAGANLYNNSKPKLARDQAQLAQRLLLPTALTDIEDARGYIVAIQAEGDSWVWDEDYLAARNQHERADRWVRALPRTLREDPRVQVARVQNLRLLAGVNQELEDHARALPGITTAVTIAEQLHASAPGDPAYQRLVVSSNRARSRVLSGLERYDEARASIARAGSVARALQAQAPMDAGAIGLTAYVVGFESQLLADAGAFVASYARGDEAVAAYREIARLGGRAPGALREVAVILTATGRNHHLGRDYAGACARWVEALTLLEQLDASKGLTSFDVNALLIKVRDRVTRGCRGGPPRSIGAL